MVVSGPVIETLYRTGPTMSSDENGSAHSMQGGNWTKLKFSDKTGPIPGMRTCVCECTCLYWCEAIAIYIYIS